MNIKALVINPWITDFKLYDEWMHPVGLYFLLSLLKQNNCEASYFNCLSREPAHKEKSNGTGHFTFEEVYKPQIYNHLHRKYKRYGVSTDIFEKHLMSISKPNVIFIGSSMTYWILGLAETVKSVSKIFADVPIVIGGTSAILMPDMVKKIIPHAHVFSGSLFRQEDLSNSRIPVLSSLTSLQPQTSLLPGFECIEWAHHAPVITSVGCPLRCSYCASSYLFPTYQPRDAETIAIELGSIQDHFNIKHFAFYDDALLYNPQSTLFPLLKILQSRDFKGQFHVPNGLHVQWVTKEMLCIMKELGFSTLRFGYESGDPTFAVHTKKKTSQDQLGKKVSLMKSAGFSGSQLGVYVMAGLTDQTQQHVLAEMAFVSSLGVRVKPVFLSPVPQTPLFNYYAKQYQELTQDPLWHNDSFFITRIPGWDSESVQAILDTAKFSNQKLDAP